MVEMLSPLGPAWRPGSHGNLVGGTSVVLSETQPGSIVQAAAWPGHEDALLAAIAAVSGLRIEHRQGAGVFTETAAAFGFAPGKVLVVDEAEGLADRLAAAIGSETGTVTDLSHGRTGLRIAGPKAEWVLGKFFAVDFSIDAFPVSKGLATVHHDFFTQIQRTGPDRFDLYVFRSFARAFWTALCHASEEVGYEVM
jgi:heterotetrameric sarcosine oxidase gamma subunit